MNVLKRCCFRSMKENRKRTAVTVIGVILATALITGVACLAVSFRVSLIEYEKVQNGDYHYLFSGVKAQDIKYYAENANIERVGLIREEGYAVLEGSENPDKPYLFLRAIDREGIRSISLQLSQGRMPENDSEIVIGRHIQYNGMVNLKVGDVLDLEICRRVSDGYELARTNPYSYEEESLVPLYKKTYTIVGIVERPNLDAESREAPGYSVFTYLDPDSLKPDATDPGTQEGSLVPGTQNGSLAPGTLELYASFTDRGLKQAPKVIAGILGVQEEVFQRYIGGLYYTDDDMAQIQKAVRGIKENYWLLKWVRFSFSDGMMNMIYSMSAIALGVIVVTSVFCIRNSFMISLTEKLKLYGRLASVGTTSKQQRKIIYYEAGFLGTVGIPLGVISGILATFILVRVTGGLMEDAIEIPLVFGISGIAVAGAAVLAAVTVYLSASKAARLAAKISPINAIRGNDMVKAGRKGLKSPGYIDKLFGMGGRIAYKNLKRARVKYRTTVISIVVSVAVFIGLTAFMQLMGVATGVYYEELEYQIRVNLTLEGAYEGALCAASQEGIGAVDIVRAGTVLVDSGKVPYTAEYQKYYPMEDEYSDEYSIKEQETVEVLSLGESGYAAFCKKVGVSVEEAQDKAIVVADFEKTYYDEAQRKIVTREGEIAAYRPGDVIEIFRREDETGDDGVSGENAGQEGAAQGSDAAQDAGVSRTDGKEAESIRLEVLAQTDKKPMSMSGNSYEHIRLVVSDRWLEEHGFAGEANDRFVTLTVQCSDAGAVEEAIRGALQAGGWHYVLGNHEADYKSDRAMNLIVSIFLYGFITVVALIGVTNIFNTITTNMELRAPEFAMLRSVGMTGKEFRRMIWLEGFFYGGKALLIGIPLGIVLSLGFHRALGEGIITDFVMPWKGIAIASVAVAALLWFIMRFSMAKINRRNIIDTIQNENI